MIRKLRGRLILLTVAGLFLASAILVFAINYMNLRSLSNQAEAVLAMLAENGGQRPLLMERQEGITPPDQTPPPKPEGTPPPESPRNEEDRGRPEGTPLGQMPGNDPGARRSPEIRNAADLTNYYLVHLQEDGAVKSWESDRADLYSDEQIGAFTEKALQTGRETGRVDNMFFRRSGDLLIVVDATMDVQNAGVYLRLTALVAVLQWAVLSAGAVWLICRMIKPVDEAMEKQKQFVWDASHELKTPLAVIAANAEVLSGEIGENRSLQYIQSEVRRTDQLVQNLLTLARMEKGTVKAARWEFDLGRALLEVALPFESAVFEAGKTMDMEIAEGVQYTGNEEMIKQLTMILLSNAVKYSDDHGKIFLEMEARGEKKILRVRNTGPAIPRKDLDRIFDRFYRVDSSHNREISGNGLGLAIAKSIVEMHKGRIAVQSEEGKGTEFTVTL